MNENSLLYTTFFPLPYARLTEQHTSFYIQGNNDPNRLPWHKERVRQGSKIKIEMEKMIAELNITTSEPKIRKLGKIRLIENTSSFYERQIFAYTEGDPCCPHRKAVIKTFAIGITLLGNLTGLYNFMLKAMGEQTGQVDLEYTALTLVGILIFFCAYQPIVQSYSKFMEPLKNRYWQIITIDEIDSPLAKIQLGPSIIANTWEDDATVRDPISFDSITTTQMQSPSTILIGTKVFQLPSLLKAVLNRTSTRETGKIPHPMENRVMNQTEADQFVKNLASILCLNEEDIWKCWTIDESFINFTTRITLQILNSIQRLEEGESLYREMLRNFFIYKDTQNKFTKLPTFSALRKIGINFEENAK